MDKCLKRRSRLRSPDTGIKTRDINEERDLAVIEEFKVPTNENFPKRIYRLPFSFFFFFEISFRSDTSLGFIPSVAEVVVDDWNDHPSLCTIFLSP